jgi:drug/metabolite transporter (DMT)-like permease
MATPPGTMYASRRRALVADVLLFSVAVFWGSNFVFIKDAVERTSAVAGGSIVAGTMLYLLWRYVVATAIFAAARPKSWLTARRRDWAMGALLASFYLGGLIVQTIALQGTSPGVSGFITALSVAMVPFLYWAVARRSPGPWQIIGAVIATVGLATLSLQGDFSIRWGDALTLLGALLYALHIIGTGFFAPRMQPSTLAATQMIVSTAAMLVLAPFFVRITVDLPWQVWAAVVWTALTGTIYAFFIQSWAQRYTTSTHAAILLGFESVFAALAGIIVGMDSVTWRLLVGGSLMLTGVFVVELLPSSKGVVAEIEAEEGPAGAAGPSGPSGPSGAP